MNSAVPYHLGFTAVALRPELARIVAEAYLASGDWKVARASVLSSNALQLKTPAGAQRAERELRQRLQTLTQRQLQILAESSADDRAAMAWLAAAESSTTPKPDGGGDVQVLPAVAVRILDYLVEHDYLAAHETRSIAAELQDEEDRWHWLRRLLARKSGLDPSAAEGALGFLRESEGLYASWNEHLRATPEYARIRKQAHGRTSPEGESGEPEPTIVLEQLLEPTIHDFTAAIDWVHHDELRLTLVLPVAPHETNGVWDESDRSVRWSGRLREKGGVPTVCYALWTTPDEKFQHAHFGRTVMEGDELAQFAAMHRSLTAEQRAELDKHLTSLEPGDAIKGRVQDFQFVGAADEAAKRTVRRMVEVLASQL